MCGWVCVCVWMGVCVDRRVCVWMCVCVCAWWLLHPFPSTLYPLYLALSRCPKSRPEILMAPKYFGAKAKTVLIRFRVWVSGKIACFNSRKSEVDVQTLVAPFGATKNHRRDKCPTLGRKLGVARSKKNVRSIRLSGCSSDAGLCRKPKARITVSNARE